MILSKHGRQDIAMICLDCYYHIPFRFEFSVESDPIDDVSDTSINSFDIRHDCLYGLCPKCGSENIIFIDRLLEHPVRKLNELGYNTQHCCEGHLSKEYALGKDGQMFSQDAVFDPYLTFNPYLGEKYEKQGLGTDRAECICDIGEVLNKQHERTKMSIVAGSTSMTDVRYTMELADSLWREIHKANPRISILIQATLDEYAKNLEKDLKEIQQDFLKYLDELVDILHTPNILLRETRAVALRNYTGTE